MHFIPAHVPDAERSRDREAVTPRWSDGFSPKTESTFCCTDTSKVVSAAAAFLWKRQSSASCLYSMRACSQWVWASLPRAPSRGFTSVLTQQTITGQ